MLLEAVRRLEFTYETSHVRKGQAENHHFSAFKNSDNVKTKFPKAQEIKVEISDTLENDCLKIEDRGNVQPGVAINLPGAGNDNHMARLRVDLGL